MSEPNIKPVFLLADSQLLFWHGKEENLMSRIRKLLEQDKPDGPFNAAYIGASNDDKPEFYDIFLAAVNQAGITEDHCRMIRSKRTPKKDLKYLEEADLILLAGGDTVKGWKIIKDKFQQTIVDCYYKGALLIGISAGAVQLGLRGWREDKEFPANLFETFQLVPAVIDVHNEETDWERLQKTIEHIASWSKGFGIPTGGGAVYHPDWSFEALRHHLVEFANVKDEFGWAVFKRSLIIPGEPTKPIKPALPPESNPEVLPSVQESASPENPEIIDTTAVAETKEAGKKTGKDKKVQNSKTKSKSKPKTAKKKK
jgi:peptidase E